MLLGGRWGNYRENAGYGGAAWARYFEMGGHETDGTFSFHVRRPGWMHGPLTEVFKKGKVTAVFKGHNHVYNIGFYEEIPYVNLPQPFDMIVKDERMVDKGFEQCVYGTIEECLGVGGYVTLALSDFTATLRYKSSKGVVLRTVDLPAAA